MCSHEKFPGYPVLFEIKPVMLCSAATSILELEDANVTKHYEYCC